MIGLPVTLIIVRQKKSETVRNHAILREPTTDAYPLANWSIKAIPVPDVREGIVTVIP
jgi:hypothetical protein